MDQPWPLLLINADDFGISPPRNEGILQVITTRCSSLPPGTFLSVLTLRVGNFAWRGDTHHHGVKLTARTFGLGSPPEARPSTLPGPALKSYRRSPLCLVSYLLPCASSPTCSFVPTQIDIQARPSPLPEPSPRCCRPAANFFEASMVFEKHATAEPFVPRRWSWRLRRRYGGSPGMWADHPHTWTGTSTATW